MIKKLLYAFAFFGAITFASAQVNSTATFLIGGSNPQTFTVGQQGSDDLNDPNIVSVAGTGSVNTNNSFLGITGVLGDDTATGTFTFTLTTDSATPINTTLNLDMAKRPGCTVSGKVSVTGGAASYADTPFNFISNGSDANPVIDTPILFESLISLVDGSPLTVTITLEQMTNVDNAANPILRLENVILEKDGSLSVKEKNTTTAVKVSPNPVVNSFNLNSNDIKNVSVYNINGKLVKSFSQSDNYNISDLSSGIYSVRITTATGTKSVKIIKE